ncbi:MAG: EAL domain-containing protein [Motiliproteus sp.]|nr:EAL domain-containing protein [Motiliproteus sp.]MCW9051877.1 EAL domain-containing protein [Motiliproteus sp.]
MKFSPYSFLVAVIYLIFGSLWILFSDSVARSLVTDPIQLAQVQLYKGWFYVVVTAILAYLLIMRIERAQYRVQKVGEVRNRHLNAYRQLFNSSEISIWNEDFNSVYLALEEMRRLGVKDLREYLTQNPKRLAEIAELITINQVNRASLKLFKAASENQLITSIGNTFGEGAHQVFLDELCAIWAGDTSFRSEAKFTNLEGEEFTAIISMPIPQSKHQWSSIPVSIFDISEHKRLEDELRKSQEDTLSLLREEDRSRRALLSLLEDQKASETKLRASEERFRAIFNQQFQFMAVLSPEGIVQEINDLPLKVQKASREDYLGKPFWDSPAWASLPEWKNIWKHRMHLAVETRAPVTTDDIFLTADGEVRSADAAITALFDEQETVQCYIVQATDTTERKHAQAEMELTAQIFEQGSEGIIICNADGEMVMVNRAMCEITGYSSEELLGKNPKVLSSGRHDPDFYSNMWIQIKEQGHWQGEVWNRRKNGEVFPEWLSISTVYGDQQEVSHYIGIINDISQHKQAEEHIRHLAHYDALTDLPNRTLLNDRINQGISRAIREQHRMAVLFLDLDRFKKVNDSLGHQFGDELLIEVAGRLKSTVRGEDTVSRLGGDEFILLLPEVTGDGAAQVAEKILEVIAAPFQIREHELNITPSIGIAIYPDNGQSVDELLQCADSAMYRAKQNGRNMFRMFQPEMKLHTSRALQLDNALRRAISNNELSVYYQPQVSLEDDRIIGCEALLRWHHPDLGMVPPSEFIPIAEESGQILAIGDWVLNQAVKQNVNWQRAGYPPLVVAVNLSAAQFRHYNLTDRVQEVLDEAGLEPRLLELELTESMTMDDVDSAIRIMDRLHHQGVRLSVDDFGTGYSSLSHLKRFRVHRLKIDQSFVRDISHDVDDESIITAVIRLANSLNLKTLAEGVETHDQLDFLRQQGCDEIQGYLVSKPVPAEEFEQLLKDRMLTPVYESN